MKERGKSGKIDVNTFNGEEKPLKEGERRWYDKINYADLDIPFCARPKGKGVRLDFFAFSNLPDKALEIKESCPYRFKHSRDVHRNAHYIGMYMLYKMYIGTSKKFIEEEKIAKSTEKVIKSCDQKLFIREQFMRMFDKYVQGVLSKDAFEIGVKEIGKSLDDDVELKEWFKVDIESILTNEKSYDRAKSKLYMREYRSKDIGLLE